ncbi:MAG: hypothetical protein ACHQ1D_01640 [Nitrososphaerales archaeon]
MTKKEEQMMESDLTCCICGIPMTYGLTCSNECHEARLAQLDQQSYESIVAEENEKANEEELEEVLESDDDLECSSNRAEDFAAYNEMRYKDAKYYCGLYS